ncbi:hypothetical protein [Rhodobaculum claviforme]|uniref:Uncharacterized protein n=1 Tax=Rhodobaculum claviforme TaxID=1549854 RepID=A0A934WIM8_9RHOB|nr:hypothetical protein [Rhodobaculum claviforme]MBK5928410.1 hypothetical protein [Rhodobaculum claviforme]
MRAAAHAVALGGCLLAAGAEAEDLMPLPDAIRAGADEQYMLVRCAALYYSVYLYGGEAQLGSERAADLETRINLLMRTAALMRIEHGIDSDAAGTQIMQETSRITDLYIERYQRNYAARGLPFAPDTVWDADMDACREVMGATHVE